MNGKRICFLTFFVNCKQLSNLIVSIIVIIIYYYYFYTIGI